MHPDITKESLKMILEHCVKAVPYYANLMNSAGHKHIPELRNPAEYLQKIPILTKTIIRTNLDLLKSDDLCRRKWYFNTSGGSTGEPVKLIQDREYFDRTTAVSQLTDCLVGREVGEPEVRLWGSERDVFQGTVGFKAKFFNYLSNTMYLNAFRMSPDSMREFIITLNRIKPKLIVAYAQAIYELAKFANADNLEIVPQKAIITSAGTLYPWMRNMIETVFQCKVFNRYGSREVGNIACERPDSEGLWVAPWGNYIEIVDDFGNSLPGGVEGNILITCLTNFAMPLVRYKIGDRGTLSPKNNSSLFGQVLESVTGRNVDMFRTLNGTLVDGEYFTHLLYFRDWVKKFQVIQKSYFDITYRIVRDHHDPPSSAISEIIAKTRVLMGNKCTVTFEFVEDILPSRSGKYRYTISEVFDQ